MKMLIQWGATTGLVGIVWLSCLTLGFMLPLLAQSSEEQTPSDAQVVDQPNDRVVEKLRQVPVFLIGDSEGNPLVIRRGENPPFMPVFLSRTDAEGALSEAVENPQLAEENPTIVTWPLMAVYALRNQPDSPLSPFVLPRQQLDSARKLLENLPENSECDSSFELRCEIEALQRDIEVSQGERLPAESATEYLLQYDVPLFVAKGGLDRQYVTIEIDEDRDGEVDEKFIPLFFNLQESERVADGFRQNNPELAGTTQIEVWSLNRMLFALENSDPIWDEFVLIPLPESREFLQQEAQRQQQ